MLDGDAVWEQVSCVLSTRLNQCCTVLAYDKLPALLSAAISRGSHLSRINKMKSKVIDTSRSDLATDCIVGKLQVRQHN